MRVGHPEKETKQKTEKKKTKKNRKFHTASKNICHMVQGWRISKKFSLTCSASSYENIFEITTRPLTNISWSCTIQLFFFFSLSKSILFIFDIIVLSNEFLTDIKNYVGADRELCDRLAHMYFFISFSLSEINIFNFKIIVFVFLL